MARTSSSASQTADDKRGAVTITNNTPQNFTFRLDRWDDSRKSATEVRIPGRPRQTSGVAPYWAVEVEPSIAEQLGALPGFKALLKSHALQVA